MKILLVSTYELGRQPLHVASPAAALRRSGHEVRALDLAVDPWDPAAIEWADAVACSVYMHTSMRLALAAASRVRADRPDLPLCFYGLYAAVGRDATVAASVDCVIAGEYEPALVDWADRLAIDALATKIPLASRDPIVHLGKSAFALPARDLLPPLDRYARYVDGETERLVGAVEASHGCSERCRHCPVPAVYNGRTQVIDVGLLMADVSQLVAAGARHITFADPDFLSGPAHARRVIAAFAERFPDMSFDVTTKVEHVLANPDLWEDMAAAGCTLVVSAVESLNETILGLLDKGHTAAMADAAMVLLREHGVEPAPSFLPFTPWTTPSDVLDILDFVARHDLIPNVDAVQYTLRLLLPDQSLLLGLPEIAPFLDGYDAKALTHRWHAADPAVDTLQARLATLVEEGVANGAPATTLYCEVRGAVADAAGEPGAAEISPALLTAASRPRPRLTEPWFCCAEPTDRQLDAVVGPVPS